MRVFEGNQLPARLVAVPAVTRISEEAHDGVRAEQFERVDFTFFACDQECTRQNWKKAQRAGSSIVDRNELDGTPVTDMDSNEACSDLGNYDTSSGAT